ncbi:hypothetical protein IJ732_03065 [bacterium]|nr:hypothetical protein [bacterium]
MGNLKKILAGLILLGFVGVYTAPPAISAATLPALPQAKQTTPAASSSKVQFSNDTVISTKNPPITLSLRNSDVKQVLRMFADKAGRNIVFHASTEDTSGALGGAAGAAGAAGGQNAVVSNITMDLVDVPLNDAFRMVLQMSNLTYFLQDNTLIIMSVEAAKTSTIGRQNISVIPVRYLDASKIATFLNTNFFSTGQPGLSNGNIAVTNTERNEILLFGNRNDYKLAKQIVEQFDKKPNEETFIVNHTTPKEMSTLICKVLFKDLAKKTDDETIILPGDNDEEDDEDADDDDEDEVSTVKAGEGTIACQFRTPAEEVGSGDSGLISLYTGGLTIVYFTDRGTIYARGGTSEQMKQIKDFIAMNDQRQLQAYLEMSIIELSETGSKEFSNTWNIYSSFFTGGFDTNLASAAPMYFVGDKIPDMYQPDTPILAKYTGSPVITYSINYLIQNGKGRVLANPRILITSGKKATINLTSSYVKKVTSQVMDTVSSLSGAVQKTYDIGEDLGIEIELQPYISPDGYVTMNINPTYSTIKEQVTEPRTLVTNETLGTTEFVNDLMATLIDKRELSLKNIKIKDGETMVIGGMLKETETKRIYKFPLLGDIPLIGMLFRSTTSQKEKNELVIMLTPRIIKDSNEATENKATL